MKREDYERLGPPEISRRQRKEKVLSGAVDTVSGVHDGDGNVATIVAMMIDVEGVPYRVAVEYDCAEDLDAVIACLIAARNNLWPGK